MLTDVCDPRHLVTAEPFCVSKRPRLPAYSPPQPMPQTPSVGLVALVVDDLLLNRVLLAGALRRLGHDVVQSADGPDALRQLERREFAVVFLDWDLPGLGGDEVATLIRARP